MPLEERGPRLEIQKHQAAEERIRASILRREMGEEWRYEGRDEDLDLVRRKQRERGPQGVRRVLDRGGA